MERSQKGEHRRRPLGIEYVAKIKEAGWTPTYRGDGPRMGQLARSKGSFGRRADAEPECGHRIEGRSASWVKELKAGKMTFRVGQEAASSTAPIGKKSFAPDSLGRQSPAPS